MRHMMSARKQGAGDGERRRPAHREGLWEGGGKRLRVRGQALMEVAHVRVQRRQLARDGLHYLYTRGCTVPHDVVLAVEAISSSTSHSWMHATIVRTGMHKGTTSIGKVIQLNMVDEGNDGKSTTK